MEQAAMQKKTIYADNAATTKLNTAALKQWFRG